MTMQATNWLDTASDSNWAEQPFFAETVLCCGTFATTTSILWSSCATATLGIVDLDQLEMEG